MPENKRKDKPGDHCRMLRGPEREPLVEHWDCDEHPNGTVTNCVTGAVIKSVVN